MRLRSRVPGRERWDVPCVRGAPDWAASVESILGSEDGITSVVANPSTGRVLVEFHPSRVTVPVEILLQRALASAPVYPSELISKRHAGNRQTLLRSAAASELACLICKAAFVGFCPWTTVAMFSAAFLVHRVVPDKTRGIRDDKKRTQIVEHGSDNGIYVAESGEA
jgi:hypothetical protein